MRYGKTLEKINSQLLDHVSEHPTLLLEHLLVRTNKPSIFWKLEAREHVILLCGERFPELSEQVLVREILGWRGYLAVQLAIVNKGLLTHGYGLAHDKWVVLDLLQVWSFHHLEVVATSSGSVSG